MSHGHDEAPERISRLLAMKDVPRWSAAVLLAAFGMVYWLFSPATIDGDAIGYLRQVRGTGFSPGHLLYLPLLRTIARLIGYNVLMDLVPTFKALSIVSALLSLILIHDVARRIYDQGQAIFVVALLGASHAFFRSATQVEVYSVATLLVVAALWASLRARLSSSMPHRICWTAGAGLCCGLGVLFHLSLILLGPSFVLLHFRGSPMGQRFRLAFITAGSMAVTVTLPLMFILHHEGHSSFNAAWTYLRSSDHGLPYLHSWRTPLAALWGLVKALIYVPYPFEAPRLAVGGLTLLGALAWLGLGLLKARSPRELPDHEPAGSAHRLVDTPFLLYWSGPLLLFALYFFPSDTERWIFIMPVLALFLGPIARTPIAWILLGAIAFVNIFVGALPQSIDRTKLEVAATVERFVEPKDLVVGPGHGWDELIGLSTPNPVRLISFIFYVGQERSLARATRKLETEIRRTLARGGRVYVARLRDDHDRQGFKELVWFGMSPEAFFRLFAPYRPEPAGPEQLWLLSSPTTAR
jgi:hypothetical protein